MSSPREKTVALRTERMKRTRAKTPSVAEPGFPATRLRRNRRSDWSRRLARNTRYTIHPEEVLADNLALLVRRRLGVAAHPADGAFLPAFEDVLAAHGPPA